MSVHQNVVGVKVKKKTFVSHKHVFNSCCSVTHAQDDPSSLATARAK